MIADNPEFTRNLWQQFSRARAIVAPLVLGIAVLGYSYGSFRNFFSITDTAQLFFFVIAAFWGTRRAADSLAEEVASGTWDAQRMSGHSAWQMAWGKLFGATSYVWYCGLLCLVVLFYPALGNGQAADSPVNLFYKAALLVVSAACAQAIALATALLLLRKSRSRRRLVVTFAQAMGLAPFAFVPFPLTHISKALSEGQIKWYGDTWPVQPFYLVSFFVFCVWSWISVYRLMRLELQYRNWPFVWCGFLVFIMFYLAGFISLQDAALTLGARLGIAAVTGVLLTYVSFFSEAKDPIRYRWAIKKLGVGDWRQGLSFLPLWPFAYLLTFIAGLLLAAVQRGMLPVDLEIFMEERSWIWPGVLPVDGVYRAVPFFMIATILLFVLRDMLFLLYLNFSRTRQRADMAGLIYLGVSYWPLAALLGAFHFNALLPFVMPYNTGNGLTSAGPVVVQLAIVGLLLFRCWRSNSA